MFSQYSSAFFSRFIRTGARRNVLVSRAEFRLAGKLLAAFIVLCTAVLSDARPASAYYWSATAGGTTNTCTDGASCALWQQHAVYGNNIVQGPCYPSYDQFNGLLVGYRCDGWLNTSSWFVRPGFASLYCESGEIRTTLGCDKSVPPDKNPRCEQVVGNPIDSGSGLKIEYAQDFASADGRLVLERYYVSNTGYLYGNFNSSRLGRGWRTSFDSIASSDGAGRTTFVLPNGQVFYFVAISGTFYQQYYNRSSNAWAYGSQGEKATVVKDTVNSRYLLTTGDGTTWTYNSSGRLRFKTYRDGYTQTLVYDTNNLNTYVEDSFGRRIDFTYNANQLLISAQVLNGPEFKYSYLGRYDSNVSTAPGVSDRIPSILWALEYVIQPDSTPGNPSDNPRIRYHYENTDFPFALTGITDERGIRTATWSYDTKGRAAESQHANGTDRYQLVYDDVANTTTVINPLSKEAIYHFAQDVKGLNRLTQIEGTASSHCAASDSYYAYDTNNFVSGVTDAEGRVTHYVRDTRGNPTSVTRAYGTPSAQTDTYTWHSTINVPTQTVQPGLTTDYIWTSGQLAQITQTDTTTQTVPYSTNGQTRTWAFTYSTEGLLLTADGPLAGSGDTVTYTYNATGYVETITNEVGQVTTVTSWSPRGQPLTLTDPNGVDWALTYDDLGRVKSVTRDVSGAAAVTSFDYNAAGDATKVTRPNGSYFQYTYDDARRIAKVEDNNGAYIEYDRDDMGNATARRIKDSGGTLMLSQTATYDELGRLLTFVGSNSQTWTHAYDKTDNRISVTDPRSNVYQWAFDALNRLTSETDEDNGAITLTRNGKDEITNYSDPRSLDTGYVRNGFGNAIQRTSPDMGTTVYEYNAIGKVTKITDGRSVVTNLTYDNAGRLLTRQYPATTAENITYTWDATASGNKGIGRLTKIEDASGSIEWAYDALGYVTQEKKTTATIAYTVDYTYDADGNVTQMTYPSGRTVNFSRDALGRISDVATKKDSGSSTVTLASSIGYQPFGPLQSINYGNGLILWNVFTSDYLLDVMYLDDPSTSTSLINRAYTRTDDINLTNIWDNVDTSRNESYWYVYSNKLQNADGNWGSLTYWYDGVGNRTAEIVDVGGTTTTNLYGYPYNNNLLQNVTQGATTVRSFTHDGAGNITADTRGSTAYNYRYNGRGRLDRLTIGSTVTADYTYDGMERMAIRTTQNMTPAGTTHYVYDLSGRLIVEASSTGATLREYIWVDDTPLAVVADVDTATPHLYYVHPDHLNRPSKMTDGAKAVVWDAAYRPFGEVYSITGPASNNLRFPGQYFLLESGLHYNWHRHYDPTIGRYIQSDPIGDVIATQPVDLYGSMPTFRGGNSKGSQASSNISLGIYSSRIGAILPEFVDSPSSYAYAKSAPAMYVDPTGLLISPVTSLGNTICNSDLLQTGNSGMPRNNQAQNKQFNDVVKILRITPGQAQQLHREISGRELGFHEILEIGKDMFGK